MSNLGRTLISALNAGDYQSVDQYTDLSDLDLKIVNHHVHELFERAVRTENFKLFRALLKIPKVQVSSTSYCALRHAVQQGLVDFVSDLVRIPTVNPNLLDKDGNAALHLAMKGSWSQKKALDMARAILLIPKVKANLRARNSLTALHMAVQRQWFDVALALVTAGAHPKIEDSEGNTALSMALPHFGDMPGDLFERMISFNDDLPEEEQAETVEATGPPEEEQPKANPQPNIPQDQQPANRVAGPQHNQDQPQGLRVVEKIDLSQFDRKKNKNTEPIIRKVETKVEDSQQPDPNPSPIIHHQLPQDQATLDVVLDGQGLDDTLVKQFLFMPNPDDPRMRLHRQAAAEQLGDILAALRLSGQSIDLEDARRIDPASGNSLWHASARHGSFGVLLEYLQKAGQLPNEEDLSALGHEGLTPAVILDAQAKLLAVLSMDLWTRHPRLLTALLSGLPDKRKRSFAVQIAKAHLLLAHAGV